MTWEPIPRWIHFKPLDTTFDTPGSVLTNLQFLIDSDYSKRIFKQVGIMKRYKLCSLIVCGFELNGKESDDDLRTKIKVDINDVMQYTTEMEGRYPFWNQMLVNEVELDWKLDFAPDINVSLTRQSKGMFTGDEEEEMGKFTVPIRCAKKQYKYPHYFNLINRNQRVGRVMAMFYIYEIDQKKKFTGVLAIEEMQKKLMKENLVKLSISLLGLRQMDIVRRPEDFSLEVSITQIQSEKAEGVKQIIEKREIKENYIDMNQTAEEETSLLNTLDNIEFEDIKVFGDNDFMVFPFIKISLKHNGFFGIQERFLIYNLARFCRNVDISERTLKLWRDLFDINLDVNTIDQEFIDILNTKRYLERKKEEQKEDEDKELYTPNVGDGEQNIKLENNRMLKIKVKEMENYKNSSINDVDPLQCHNKDKEVEKMAKKEVRYELKLKIRELRKQELTRPEDTELLIKYTEELRDLKKPVMSEDLFFGFDDLTDEYDYGREIYREDIYEKHPNMNIHFLKEKMFSFDKGLFGESFTDMGFLINKRLFSSRRRNRDNS